ncbi:hypothetical protein [Peribacillus frigoritolerans]|uniref:hypothetical protein n=1 Tax=Peribacillus frigoritolerans TaxID=450367 RepID=UPI0007BF1C60|nr:hypothetical protein [Peribacillus frigoritolerans]MCM3169501.1 hypothetical protein [Peribacillus frigoritolerans]
MTNVEQQFINMIMLQQEKLADDQIDDKLEKFIDLHQEYMMTKNIDYDMDYREIESDPYTTDGEKSENKARLVKLVDDLEKRGEEIEKEMSEILTKEFLEVDANKSQGAI